MTVYSFPNFRATLVPSTRLLVLAGAVLAPATLLAILPGSAALGYGLIGLVTLATVFDALTAPRKLNGIALRTAGIVRLWKDREGDLELVIQNAG